MIRTFPHKGLEEFFGRGSKAGIQPAHAGKLGVRLGALDVAKSPADMGLPGWKLHPLTGNLKGHWAVWVSGDWGLTFTFTFTFTFDSGDAILVDCQDYR